MNACNLFLNYVIYLSSMMTTVYKFLHILRATVRLLLRHVRLYITTVKYSVKFF